MNAVDPSVPAHREPPLVVDLDGCLIRTDLLHESCLLLARQRPMQLWRLPVWLARGKAHLKQRIAERVSVEPELLPYSDEFVDYLRAERAAGRSVLLATASDRRLAERVADHLGLFDAVIASDGNENLAGPRKLQAIRATLGGGDFDYAGNSRVDLAIWPHARRALLVNASGAVERAARETTAVERVFPGQGARLKDWLRALRVHQWLKNLLLFVPLFTAHAWNNMSAVANVLAAFAAFSLCASATYVVNDLLDLPSDRAHPTKRRRPFAAGAIPVGSGVALSLATLLAGLALGLWAGREFLIYLLLYIAITLAYSFHLKTYVLIDTITLAGLYTLRVIAGGAAAGIPLSFWLLAFSMFLFLSLAMVKRYSELRALADASKLAAKGRDYRVSDLPGIGAMGVASGYLAVLVFALYLQTPEMTQRYSHPKYLWLTLPIVLYWISRMWLKAGRGEMHDDPLVYTVFDRASRFLVIAAALVVIAAV